MLEFSVCGIVVHDVMLNIKLGCLIVLPEITVEQKDANKAISS